MLIKIIICVLLLFIVINLVRAGVAMLRQQDSTLPMSHFLGRRVMYSAIILVLILVAMALGWITPNARPY
jgi:hypothetical protein